MNSKDDHLSASGAEAASEGLDADQILHEHFKSSEMKRAAAKELIERYYFQVKDGCGNDECTNEYCASSGLLQVTSADQAAAQALRLFQTKAPLCVANPAKVAKIPPLHPHSPSDSVASGAGSHVTMHHSANLTDLASKAGLSSPQSTSTGGVDVMSKSTSTIAAAAGSSHEAALLPMTTATITANPAAIDLVLPPLPSSTTASTSKETQSIAKPAEKKELLFLTERRVQEIVDICLAENTFSLLIRTIGQVYCSAESLMLSFRKPPRCLSVTASAAATTTTDTVLSKEDRRAFEADQDKDRDSSQQPDEAGSVTPITAEVIATATSSSTNDPDDDGPHLRPDEITLDLESLRRAYKILYELPSLPFQGALVNALLILFENAELELRFGDAFRRQPRHYLNIFVAVLEIPALGHHLASPRDPHLYQPHEDFVDVVLPSLCRAAANLPLDAQARLARVINKEYDAACLKRLLDALHQLITTRVFAGQMKLQRYCVNEDEVVMAATRTMKILFYAAVLGGIRPTASDGNNIASTAEEEEDAAMMAAIEDNDSAGPLRDLVAPGSVSGSGGVGIDATTGAATSKERRPAREDPLARELAVRASDCRRPTVPLEDFYNEPLNDQLEVDKDFTNFKAESEQPRFSFMNYAFILTPATKAMSLYYDNRVRMYSERRISVLQSMVRNEPNNPYLKLKVRRDHIISDALIELEMVAMENPNDLKKQLVVEFESEQGIDEGGVSKEFFQLVVDEIFNPDFGMFTLNPETQMYWFNPSSFESDGQFMLIGIVLGLAIYNNVILDIHLPHVVYRKLMNKRGVFEDLSDLDPALYQGLVELKNYTNDEDVEDVFMQTFRISYKDMFGTPVTHLLKENGDQIPVNNINKKEFLEMYADFLLNKSIERQFRAFRRGFQIVTDESPLKWLFRPEEVELLVCGSNVFDFNALEESTEYDGGYSAATATIRQFWEIVHDLTSDEKRKLLQFTTGSDRAPVGGLSKLKLIISRNGPDSNRLPTAHTCFNVLLLPEYSSKEKLKDRLLKAINYSKGFGML